MTRSEFKLLANSLACSLLPSQVLLKHQQYKIIIIGKNIDVRYLSSPQASDFTDIGDWPTLSAAVAGPRCHSTPPPQDTDSSHHNGNADQDRKPLEEHHHQQQPKAEKVEPTQNHQTHGDKHDKQIDKTKPQ
ncbi:hypothetical protein evm_015516, partial [Chilo suppressalis]